MRFNFLTAANSQFLALDGNEWPALRSARFMSGKNQQQPLDRKPGGTHSRSEHTALSPSVAQLITQIQFTTECVRQTPVLCPFRNTSKQVLRDPRISCYIGSWRGAAGLCSRCSGLLRAGRFGVRNPVRERVFLCPTPVQTDLAPTQPPGQWTPDLFSMQSGWRVALTPSPSTEVKNKKSCTSSPLLFLHGKIWGDFHQEQLLGAGVAQSLRLQGYWTGRSRI